MAGRPTKYKGQETIAAVEAIIEQMTIEKFFSFCSVDHIAYALDTCRATIYNWQDQYPEFLDTIKKWEAKRNKLFYILCMQKNMSPAVWIFLAKNWLGMTDRTEHAIGGSENLPPVRFVDGKQYKKELQRREKEKGDNEK